jgi:hypothetical protein
MFLPLLMEFTEQCVGIRGKVFPVLKHHLWKMYRGAMVELNF